MINYDSQPPNFFIELIEKKTIKNTTQKEIEELFPFTVSESIDISKFKCVCTGLIGRAKGYLIFHFKTCQRTPLKGRHELIIGNKTVPIKTLTKFKKIFGFTDAVSFERSTFLLHEEARKAVRLQLIRSRICLPTQNGINTEIGTNYDYFSKSNMLYAARAFMHEIHVKSYENMESEGSAEDLILLICEELLVEIKNTTNIILIKRELLHQY